MLSAFAAEIATYLVCRVSTAQSNSGAESEVQPKLERADVGPDAEWGGHSCETAGWAYERARRSAEIVIVVFEEVSQSRKAYSPPTPTVQPPRCSVVVAAVTPVTRRS
jgi:hypothetical protein